MRAEQNNSSKGQIRVEVAGCPPDKALSFLLDEVPRAVPFAGAVSRDEDKT